MLTEHRDGMFSAFRRTPWRFQQTFHTPVGAGNLQNGPEMLEQFVSTIVDSLGPEPSGAVVIDKIVFDPTHLETLLARHRLSCSLRNGSTIVAETPEELKQLLHTSLADWVSFLLIPTPKPFVLYTDHDEYATFFANTRSNLNRVTTRLAGQGFQEVEGYIRDT